MRNLLLWFLLALFGAALTASQLFPPNSAEEAWLCRGGFVALAAAGIIANLSKEPHANH
jgi:hypothetical protein